MGLPWLGLCTVLARNVSLRVVLHHRGLFQDASLIIHHICCLILGTSIGTLYSSLTLTVLISLIFRRIQYRDSGSKQVNRRGQIPRYRVSIPCGSLKDLPCFRAVLQGCFETGGLLLPGSGDHHAPESLGTNQPSAIPLDETIMTIIS